MGNKIPRNGKLSAKAFFADLHEKSDNTRVAKPKIDEAASERGKRKRMQMVNRNNDLEKSAQELEAHGQVLRKAAREGKAPAHWDNAGAPLSKKEAKDLIHGYEGAEDWEDVALNERGAKEYPNPKDPEHPISNREYYEKNRTFKPRMDADEMIEASNQAIAREARSKEKNRMSAKEFFKDVE